jgi:hypothetical protein
MKAKPGQAGHLALLGCYCSTPQMLVFVVYRS